MFGLKRKKIEKMESQLAKGKEEVAKKEQKLEKEKLGATNENSPWLEGKMEALEKDKARLNVLQSKIDEGKSSIDNSALSKLKQAGDVILETRKMMEDASIMMQNANGAIVQAKKTTKTIGVIGGVALGVAITANVATIVTCCKLSGKNIHITFRRKR